MSVERMAEAMYKAERREGWRRRWGIAHEVTRELFLDRARTALDFVGFPKDAEPAEGCVEKAIEALREAEDELLMVSDETHPNSGKWKPRLSAQNARKKALDALRALGAAVEGASSEGRPGEATV